MTLVDERVLRETTAPDASAAAVCLFCECRVSLLSLTDAKAAIPAFLLRWSPRLYRIPAPHPFSFTAHTPLSAHRQGPGPPVPQFTACLSEPSPGGPSRLPSHPPPPTGLWGDHRMRSGGVQGPWESFRHRTDDRNVQRREREAGGGALTSGKTGDVLLGPQLGGHVRVTRAWHRANTAMLSL